MRICDLTASQESTIASELAKSKSTLEIYEIIGRYQQTMKTSVTIPMKKRNRADRGQLRSLFYKLCVTLRRIQVLQVVVFSSTSTKQLCLGPPSEKGW